MFKQHLTTPETLRKKLSHDRNRGYATVSPTNVRPSTSKKNRAKTSGTIATRSSTKSLILEEHASSQAQSQLSTNNSNQILETPSPIDQSRRPRSRASVESTRLSHAWTKSSSLRPSLEDQTGRRQAIIGHKGRTEWKVDDDLDDVNDSTRCCLCPKDLDATNRHTCKGHTCGVCSRAICSGCLINCENYLPEHKFSQEVDEVAGAAASPSQSVSIRRESPIQYQCESCKKILATRYFCQTCRINLCELCCYQLHPTEHTIQELQTGRPTSPGRQPGYVLGEVSDSIAVLDDSDLDESDVDGPSGSHKSRQGQGRPKRKSQQGQLSQPSAHQWTPSIMLEKLPEQPLLAKLREQPGATTLKLNREHVTEAVKYIQASRRRLQLIERAKGGPLHNDALPSAKRSAAKSPSTSKVGSSISMRDSTSSDSDDSNDEEPAPDRGLRVEPGVMRDLLEFDLPRSEPKCYSKIRKSRWTREDKRLLRKLKSKRWDNADIAEELNRSQTAISQQWAKQNKCTRSGINTPKTRIDFHE